MPAEDLPLPYSPQLALVEDARRGPEEALDGLLRVLAAVAVRAQELVDEHDEEERDDGDGDDELADAPSRLPWAATPRTDGWKADGLRA